MRKRISALAVLLVLLSLTSAAYAGKKQKSDTAVAEMQLPADYDIDLQLAINARSNMMRGGGEITGTPENNLGRNVFTDLVHAGFSQPYPWKLTLVNSAVVNASASAGGQVYVYGGMLKMLSSSAGLWAATLSHEVAHTGLRHQVRVYLQQVYNQRMMTYYRARAQAGDQNANWALLGFSIAAPIALKKLERDQEHVADQSGMMLMARAGYHPDFVFALHHLLRLQTGEQSKFGAFFSDHPRWETRDQRSERVYADAVAEYNRLWPNSEQSPGGTPPPVAFIGGISSRENKSTKTADVAVPLFCRNQPTPVKLTVFFTQRNQPVKTGPANADLLRYAETVPCPTDDSAAPVVFHIPANTLTGKDRKFEAEVAVTSEDGVILEFSRKFKVTLPKQ